MVLSPINALRLGPKIAVRIYKIGRISAIFQDGVRVPCVSESPGCVAYHGRMKRAFVENK